MLRLVLILAWILISTFQYGFHIASLNQSQAAITCNHEVGSLPTISALPDCVPMSSATFGFLTSVYTLGGLFGSIFAANLTPSTAEGKVDRRRPLLYSAALVFIGSTLVAIGSNATIMAAGRFITGLGCGISTVVVPLFVAEVSPANIRGSLGILTQVSIVTGLFIAQLVSIPLSKPYTWRYIMGISSLVAILQFLSSPYIPHRTTEKVDTERDDSVRDALLEHDELNSRSSAIEEREREDPRPTMTLSEVWRTEEGAVRKGFNVIVLLMTGQQLSGINAVMYYSTDIMSSVLELGSAKYVSLFITLVNLILTFPPIFVIDRLGRKPLVFSSIFLMTASCLILALSITAGAGVLSSVAILLFVAAFSFGLGPIPFVVMGEIVPSYASSATGSIALGLNWGTNFFVGLLFLPVKDFLTGPDGEGQGRVFFVFVAAGAFVFLSLIRIWR